MTVEAWLIFVGIWTLAGLPLGPNAANCIAVAATQGFGRALWAVAGILLAGCLYMALVILGLGAVLLANEVLFSALKIAGALYLIWLGIRLLRSSAPQVQPGRTPPLPPISTLRKAVLISLSNPKAMISYGAVFSQFITPGPEMAGQLLVIVPTALVVVALIYMGYALIGVGAQRLLTSARRLLWFNRGIGGFYVVAGAGLLAAEANAVGAR